MNNYYFLATALPELNLETRPDLSFEELLNLFEMNLNFEDLEKTRVIRLLIDIKNIYYFLTKEPFDPRGNLSKKELEESLLNLTNFPDYVLNFLQSYESDEQKIRYFSKLIVSYFRNAKNENKGFLHEYLAFERNLRLVLSAFRVKHRGLDLSVELQFEDPHDFLVHELLAVKDSPEFQFPFEFEDLQPILLAEKRDPIAEYQQMLKYRLNKIEEITIDTPFTIDWLLSYMTRLMAVEEWFDLDEKKGNFILNEIVKDIA